MLTKALKRYTIVPNFSASRAFSFKFPKHNELFADDYYEPKQNENETPYDHKFAGGDDVENYEKSTHRKSTAGGILSSYKKQLNLSPEDILNRDYMNKMHSTKMDMERKFNQTKPEVFTKNYTMRLRLRRDLNAEFPADGQEYGDYEKFDKNKVEQLNDKGLADEGHDNFQKNYNEMIRQMKTEEGDAIREVDKENFANTVNDYDTHLENI
jgi:hypothetical protein